MSKFIKSVAAAAVLATSATGTHAASLSTDVDVSLPSVIALFCFDSVSVDVTAAGLRAALGGLGEETVLTGAATLTSFSDNDLGATGAAGTANTEVELELNNVCAFRALVEDGVDVTVTRNSTTLDSDDADSSASIAVGTIELATDEEFDAEDLGLAVLEPISVTIPLNLANATSTGSYSQADLFTVTVLAQP